MKAKRGDYVRIEYTGVLSDGTVFDTTSADEAKKAGIFDEKSKYGPAMIILGKNQAIAGLEEAIEGMDEGTDKEVIIQPDKAFGPINKDLFTIVPLSRFKDQDVNPIPGMMVNLDNRTGVIKAVSGGRVVVDFNHPLAGKELKYRIKLLKVLSSLDEKVQATFEDSELKGTVRVEGDSVIVRPETSMETEFLVRKQAFLRWLTELPEIKRARFEEEYILNKEQASGNTTKSESLKKQAKEEKKK